MSFECTQTILSTRCITAIRYIVLNERETWEKHCAYYWKSRAILYVTRHKVQTWGRKAIYAVQCKAQAKTPRENSQLIAKQFAKSLYIETVLNMMIGIVQKVQEWPSCPYPKWSQWEYLILAEGQLMVAFHFAIHTLQKSYFGINLFCFRNLTYSLSITDGVHRNENFVEIIPVFSTFGYFFKKKKKIIKAILCNFSMRLLKYF
mgnify:CR=1 FL=1